MRSKEDKATETYLKITSYAPYSEMNGIPRELIEKYIATAMDEYAIDVLEWFFSQQYHPGSVDVDARDSAEKTYKNYLEILESKNNESKA